MIVFFFHFSQLLEIVGPFYLWCHCIISSEGGAPRNLVHSTLKDAPMSPNEDEGVVVFLNRFTSCVSRSVFLQNKSPISKMFLQVNEGPSSFSKFKVLGNISCTSCPGLWWVSFLNPGAFEFCFANRDLASSLMNKTNPGGCSGCVRTHLSFLPQDCRCSAPLGAPRSPAGAASGSRTGGGLWSSRPSAAAGNISSPLHCCGCRRGERLLNNQTLE